MFRLVAIMGLVVALGGCADLAQGGPEAVYAHVARLVGHREPPKQPKPIYCYSTLAEADCYARPVPEDRHRLIASFPPT